MSSKQTLLKHQKHLFKLLQNRSNQILGATPSSIAQYEKEYHADFRALSFQQVRWITRDQLVQAVRNSRITWIGDYHSFGQSQRTALRIIRAAIQKGESWAIGLEFLDSSHQNILDQFQQGLLTISEFHHEIDYFKNWGFPWENLAPLLDWAKCHSVRVVALNRPKILASSLSASASLRKAGTTDSDLLERDRWAAGLICDQLTADPELRMIALYGELHVGSEHLPRHLTTLTNKEFSQPLVQTAIYHNNDRLYWKFREHLHHQSIARLPTYQRKGLHLQRFYVASSTPWARLQSLVSWTEGDPQRTHSAPNLEDDEWEESTHELCLSSIRDAAYHLSQLFQIPTPNMDQFQLHTADDGDFLERPEVRSQLTQSEFKLLRHLVRQHHRVYLPHLQLAYLSSPSENGAAEMAALYLFRTRSRALTFEVRLKEEEWIQDFFLLVVENAFGYLGSLLMNPKRKCDLLDDHRKRLFELSEGSQEEFPFETPLRRWMCLFLKKLKIDGLPTSVVQQAFKEIVSELGRGTQTQVVANLLTRYLGAALGTKLHLGVASGLIHLDQIRHLCLSRMEGDGKPHVQRLQELWELCGEVVLPATKEEGL